MLLRLMPEQVSYHWKIIKKSILESLPRIDHEKADKINNILAMLLNGNMQCWTSYRIEKKEKIIEAIIITTTLADGCSGVSSLLIYCLYGFRKISKGSWLEGLDALKKYAKSIGCSRVIGYTEVDDIIDFVKAVKGEAKYTFISISVFENQTQ